MHKHTFKMELYVTVSLSLCVITIPINLYTPFSVYSQTLNQWVLVCWYATRVYSWGLEVNGAPFWDGMRRAQWKVLVRNEIHDAHVVCVRVRVCVRAFSQPSECEQCTCDSDGIARCLVADCAPPPCVNPVYQPGTCCPECRDGKLQIAKN